MLLFSLKQRSILCPLTPKLHCNVAKVQNKASILQFSQKKLFPDSVFFFTLFRWNYGIMDINEIFKTQKFYEACFLLRTVIKFLWRFLQIVSDK